jgi:hypothetical protein
MAIRLYGVWSGTDVPLALRLEPCGTYMLSTGGGGEEGEWKATFSSLILTNAQGERSMYSYTLEGDTMVVVSGGGLSGLALKRTATLAPPPDLDPAPRPSRPTLPPATGGSIASHPVLHETQAVSQPLNSTFFPRWGVSVTPPQGWTLAGQEWSLAGKNAQLPTFACMSIYRAPECMP